MRTQSAEILTECASTIYHAATSGFQCFKINVGYFCPYITKQKGFAKQKKAAGFESRPSQMWFFILAQSKLLFYISNGNYST